MKEHINDVDTVNWLLYTIGCDLEFNDDRYFCIIDYDTEVPVNQYSETEKNPIVLKYKPMMK